MATRLQQQLDAVSSWRRDVLLQLQAGEQAAASREARMDAQRRVQALRRTQKALVARTERAIDETLALLREERPRALLVHRSSWVRHEVARRLEDLDVLVLDQVDDGADGLGIAIVEQPDVVLVEDRLPSLPAVELVAGIREYARGALVAAQVEHEQDSQQLLDAGAAAVFNRLLPPVRLADEIHTMLQHGSARQAG